MTEYVLVQIGEHEIPMTAQEAERLTDADRADLAAWCAAEDAAMEADLLRDAQAHDRVAAAAEEPGARVVLRVWCSSCAAANARSSCAAVNADAPGEIRFSSQGLVFDGVTNYEMDRRARHR